VGVAVLLVMIMGTAFGAAQGYIITKFDLQPFIITLAGMFFCRGLTAVISQDTITISDPTWVALASYPDQSRCGIRFDWCGRSRCCDHRGSAIVLKFTRFGRTVFAIGGSESSAALMGTAGIPDESYGLCNLRLLLLAGRAGVQSHHADRL
jgi:simple sugar transport system permease protein